MSLQSVILESTPCVCVSMRACVLPFMCLGQISETAQWIYWYLAGWKTYMPHRCLSLLLSTTDRRTCQYLVIYNILTGTNKWCVTCKGQLVSSKGHFKVNGQVPDHIGLCPLYAKPLVKATHWLVYSIWGYVVHIHLYQPFYDMWNVLLIYF